MADFIVTQRQGETTEVVPSSYYDAESDLQRLLAKAPELLSIVSDDRPRFVLVQQEMGGP